jgi:hypothetical protein
MHLPWGKIGPRGEPVDIPEQLTTMSRPGVQLDFVTAHVVSASHAYLLCVVVDLQNQIAHHGAQHPLAHATSPVGGKLSPDKLATVSEVVGNSKQVHPVIML